MFLIFKILWNSEDFGDFGKVLISDGKWVTFYSLLHYSKTMYNFVSKIELK